LPESKPPIDLDRLSVPELTTLVEAAQAKRQEKLEGAKAALLAEFRDKAAELGMSLKALMSSPQPAPERKPRRSKGEKVAPKYRNPKTSDIWTGWGREPSWIKGAWFETCQFQVTPEIDRALMEGDFLFWMLP